MRKTTTRLTALALALALLLTSCGGGGASAATMHLRKTEGTVGVSDNEGKDVAPRENLGLYSGYQVGTQAESYAWIDLDEVKLTKMDADSEVEITKEGKKLEINVKSGSLFFNVTEPLADDETMNIVASTMVIGVRGTCGWVTEDTAALLEGTVTVTAGNQEATVSAGEMAVLTDGVLEVKPFTVNDVPAFVVEELAGDDNLAQTVLDATGLNIPAYSMASYEELLSTLEDVVYTELIDFEQDGSPELLVVNLEQEDNNRVTFGASIYQNGPEGPKYLAHGGVHAAVERVVCSLVESNGRLFVHCRSMSSYEAGRYWGDYIGSLPQQDESGSVWGKVDYVDSFYYGLSVPHNERGLVDIAGIAGVDWQWEETGNVEDKYTLVRELYSQSF